jgi:HEAT repeat protein
MGQMGWVGRVAVLTAFVLLLPHLPTLSDLSDPSDLSDLRAAPGEGAPQVSFEAATRDLKSPDPAARLRAARMLKQTSYLEAAVPLAALIADPHDEVQLEAIGAELNIFLAEPIVPRKRIGLIVEVRKAVLAESAFSSGPLAIGARAVPPEVLTAMRLGARDDNPRVALEALYAFGVLGVEPSGSARRELLHATGPDLAAFVGASDPALRYAAVRVLGRLFTRRAGDAPIDEAVGDAVITALNDADMAIKAAAMHALAAMRYERAVQALTDLFQYYGRNAAGDAALDALARIAHPASTPVFAAELAGRNAARRGIAIEGLARLGDNTKLPGIEAAAALERNEGVALAATFASVLLGNGSIGRIADAVTKSRLREQARQYLVELAPGRAAALRSHLQDPDARLRLDVVDALGLGGDAAALPEVEPLLKDHDPQVARAAERAVARLKRPAHTPVSRVDSPQRTPRTQR